jgi:hypothetical protein
MSRLMRLAELAHRITDMVGPEGPGQQGRCMACVFVTMCRAECIQLVLPLVMVNTCLSPHAKAVDAVG